MASQFDTLFDTVASSGTDGDGVFASLGGCTMSDLDRINFRIDIERLKRSNGGPVYHDNQIATATKLAQNITSHNPVCFQIVLAPTQSGKTGCILSTIEKSVDTMGNGIPLSNIYVVTGLSSNDWVKQTQASMPSCIRSNVFHRSGLVREMKKNLAGKSDILILIDEVHVASTDKMSLDRFIKDCGLGSAEGMLLRNINIVMFTATPNNVKRDLEKWPEENIRTFAMETGPNYVGVRDLIKRGQVREAEDLYGGEEDVSPLSAGKSELVSKSMESIQNLKEFIEETYTDYNRVHIIRTPSGPKGTTVVKRVHQTFGNDYEYIECSGEDTAKLMELLETISIKMNSGSGTQILEKHYIVFVKETMRCTVTLHPKRYLGVIYERIPKSICDDVIAQGVRFTGYDIDPLNIMYTNEKSLERYLDAYDNGFTDQSGMKCGGKKKSFVDPAKYGCAAEVVEEPKTFDYIVHEDLFNSYEDAVKFLKTKSIEMGCTVRSSGSGSIHEIDGYSVTSKRLVAGKQVATMSADDRITLEMARGISPGTGISSTKKGARYLILPVYESMASPPDSVKFQARYISHYA